MYKIFVKTNTIIPILQPIKTKTIKAAKARYADTMLDQIYDLRLEDIDEIIIYRGKKIYGYYDQYFNRKSNR